MKLQRFLLTFVLILALTMAACEHGEKTILAAGSSPEVKPEQQQSAASTVQSFTAVEGADLRSRLEAANRLGGGTRTPYWSAYTFDVRPGVAVDPGIQEFHGSMNTIGDTSVFVGTTASGMTVETRNLAIFLLRQGSAAQLNRLEIYNLERKREYSGYPVYWMGRANNEESLAYLRALADSSPLDTLAERAVLAIALHDDARVPPMLKTFASSSPNQRIRSSSVYWLGQVGGEQKFLADLVRSETEDPKIRKQAAHAIGESREAGSLQALQELYGTVKDAEVRRAVIRAVGDNRDQDGAIAFLLKVSRTEVDTNARRNAVRELGNFERENVVEDLFKIYQDEKEYDVKRAVLHSLAETKNPRGQARLLELARNEPNTELRRQAIHRLSDRGEAVVEDLIKLFDSESNITVRRTLLQALSEVKSTRVEDKMFVVARDDSSIDVRRQAIRLLGERAGQRSLDFLSAMVQSVDSQTEVQLQAVRAISERQADEAVPLLIKIAKTHSNQHVRKQAIRSLGESGDPRAIEFFREVLAK